MSPPIGTVLVSCLFLFIADLAFEYSCCASCYGTYKKLDVVLPGYVRFLTFKDVI